MNLLLIVWTEFDKIFDRQPNAGLFSVLSALRMACQSVANSLSIDPAEAKMLLLAGSVLDSWSRDIDILYMSNVDWNGFIDDVNAYLELEGSEPDESAEITWMEVVEAVTAGLDELANSREMWGYWSNKQKVSGLRQRMRVPVILSRFTLAFRSLAEWHGEGTQRAGEEIPRQVYDHNYDPDDYGFGLPGTLRKRRRRRTV